MARNAGTRTAGERAAAQTADGAAAQTAGERITVTLIPRAGEGLQLLVARTGLSKTDIVNRAITLYEFIESKMQAGNDLILRGKTGETEVIRLL
jgi:hypothetical protein